MVELSNFIEKNQRKLIITYRYRCRQLEMKHRIKQCKVCNNYTLKDVCQICNRETHDPHPPKFSLEDKYIRYRIVDAHKNRNKE